MTTARRLWTVLLLAAVPFLVKLCVLTVGATGYGWQSLYKIAQLAIPICWRRTVDRRRGWAMFWPVDEPLPGRRTWGIAVGVAAALAGSAVFGILFVAPQVGIDADPSELRRGFDERFTLTPTTAVLVVLYLLTLNAALEELHFRAWLDRELSARMGNAAGIAISSTAFALMHLFIFAGLPGAGAAVFVAVFLGLVTAGLAWSLIARLPGGIHAAWLSHGLTDAGLLTWGLFWLGYFG